jgi:hypothetical protein
MVWARSLPPPPSPFLLSHIIFLLVDLFQLVEKPTALAVPKGNWISLLGFVVRQYQSRAKGQQDEIFHIGFFYSTQFINQKNIFL